MCLCCSPTGCVKSVFGVVMFCALVLTLVSIFTPQWRNLDINVQNKTTGQNLRAVYNFGLTFSKCFLNVTSLMDCTGFTNAPQYQQISIIALGIGAASAASALVYSFVINCLACCLCCLTCLCENCLVWPLLLLSFVGCVADTVGVAVFGIKSGAELPPMPTTLNEVNLNQNTVGWSLVIAIVAIGCFLLDFLLAIALIRMHKVSPT